MALPRARFGWGEQIHLVFLAAVGQEHAGAEQLIGTQLGNIGPEIDGKIGRHGRLGAEPVLPCVNGGAVVGGGKPALVTHHKLVAQGAGVHFGSELEELRPAGIGDDNAVLVVADGGGVGEEPPIGQGDRARGPLQRGGGGGSRPGNRGMRSWSWVCRFLYYIIYLNICLHAIIPLILRSYQRSDLLQSLPHFSFKPTIGRHIEILRLQPKGKVVRSDDTARSVVRILISLVVALFRHAFHGGVAQVIRHLQRRGGTDDDLRRVRPISCALLLQKNL